MSERSVLEHSGDQLASGGANPTRSLHFMPCALGHVSWFIKRYHYSHTHPGGIDFSFAAIQNGILVGACVFGYMAGNPKAMCVCKQSDDPSKYRELMRLVLLDEIPKNSESRFIAWCLRWLRSKTDLLAVISFADPKFGHTGVIYRASNWIYTGLQNQDRPRLLKTHADLFGSYEQEIHPRQAYDRIGSSSMASVSPCRIAAREPKHRYVYLLRRNLTLIDRLKDKWQLF